MLESLLGKNVYVKYNYDEAAYAGNLENYGTNFIKLKEVIEIEPRHLCNEFLTKIYKKIQEKKELIPESTLSAKIELIVELK